MTLTIHLLGRPNIERGAGDVYRFRSQKSWGLLALLILSERPPSRRWLSSLLFESANDPLRALRWSLSEVRRALGPDSAVHGDPVALELPEDAMVDVNVLSRGRWSGAVPLPGLGHDLLDSANIQGAPAFESWLLSQRRHFAALSEAVLHEAALASMARGEPKRAIDFAVKAVGLNPFDENNQALLISLYSRTGDRAAAEAQIAACTELFEAELGVPPGPTIRAALRHQPPHQTEAADDLSIEAAIESGSAAIAAGAVGAGIQSVRRAVAMSDASGADVLRVTSRLVLATALVHSLRGQDEEGSAILHEADRIAMATSNRHLAARARAELGYVDFLRARYDRAEVWLEDSLALAIDRPSTAAAATTYLGCVASDRARYGEAIELLEEGIDKARTLDESRMEAYALSMLGRVHMLRGDLGAAAALLDSSIELCERFRWLSLLPWPQALRGEVEIALGDIDGAARTLGQAFARACQLGDPCWEGTAARGLALLAHAEGDIQRAFDVLTDAHRRCNRLADPYVWLEAYILDAKAVLGLEHGHPDTASWIEDLHVLASRGGMRELIVRSVLHRSALGDQNGVRAARLLAEGIDNPLLAIALGTQ